MDWMIVICLLIDSVISSSNCSTNNPTKHQQNTCTTPTQNYNTRRSNIVTTKNNKINKQPHSTKAKTTNQNTCVVELKSEQRERCLAEHTNTVSHTRAYQTHMQTTASEMDAMKVDVALDEPEFGEFEHLGVSARFSVAQIAPEVFYFFAGGSHGHSRTLRAHSADTPQTLRGHSRTLEPKNNHSKKRATSRKLALSVSARLPRTLSADTPRTLADTSTKILQNKTPKQKAQNTKSLTNTPKRQVDRFRGTF